MTHRCRTPFFTLPFSREGRVWICPKCGAWWVVSRIVDLEANDSTPRWLRLDDPNMH